MTTETEIEKQSSSSADFVSVHEDSHQLNIIEKKWIDSPSSDDKKAMSTDDYCEKKR